MLLSFEINAVDYLIDNPIDIASQLRNAYFSHISPLITVSHKRYVRQKNAVRTHYLYE